ncbi:MAG: hypothetical protein QXG65_05075 [Thermoplasmata archaeon]
MGAAEDPPPFRTISPTQRVDLLVSDWHAELDPALDAATKVCTVYGRAWEAYREGDYGFGLWCWRECDRLTLALPGGIRDVRRLLGPGRYFGFPHRRAVAERVPFDRVYRPRKGDMSTPRPDAFVLPHYQVLCLHALRARGGDPQARAQYAIALGELEEMRRADPYLRFFETFRDLLERSGGATAAAPAPPAGPSEAAPHSAQPPRPGRPRGRNDRG